MVPLWLHVLSIGTLGPNRGDDVTRHPQHMFVMNAVQLATLCGLAIR